MAQRVAGGASGRGREACTVNGAGYRCRCSMAAVACRRRVRRGVAPGVTFCLLKPANAFRGAYSLDERTAFRIFFFFSGVLVEEAAGRCTPHTAHAHLCRSYPLVGISLLSTHVWGGDEAEAT